MSKVIKESSIIKKLKKQLAAFKQRERKAHQQLKNALLKAKKATEMYKRKLTQKNKDVNKKIASVDATVYADMVLNLQKNLLRKKKRKSKKTAFVIAKAKKMFPVKKSSKKAKKK